MIITREEVLQSFDVGPSVLKIAEAWSERFSHLQTVVYCTGIDMACQVRDAFAYISATSTCATMGWLNKTERKSTIDKFNKRITRLLTMAIPEPIAVLPNVECIIDLRVIRGSYGFIHTVDADGEWESIDVIKEFRKTRPLRGLPSYIYPGGIK